MQDPMLAAVVSWFKKSAGGLAATPWIAILLAHRCEEEGTMKTSIAYQGQLRWVAGEGTARIVVDAGTPAGGLGEGYNPKALVLQGLASCSGMDVATMLERQAIPFSDLAIDVEAEQTGRHPKVFKTIHMTYWIRAQEAHEPKVRRAIELSHAKFCGVSAMLEKTAEISWELILEGPPELG